MRSLILAAATVLALTGCESAGGGNATPPSVSTAPSSAPATSAAEPRSEAAVRQAAADEFDSFAAGDYGAAWDRFYAPAKKAISRAEYLRLLQLCPDVAHGVKFSVDKVTLVTRSASQVRVSRMGLAVASYRFVYESGRWVFVPAPDTMRDFRTKSVQQMAADQRAQGGCGQG